MLHISNGRGTTIGCKNSNAKVSMNPARIASFSISNYIWNHVRSVIAIRHRQYQSLSTGWWAPQVLLWFFLARLMPPSLESSKAISHRMMMVQYLCYYVIKNWGSLLSEVSWTLTGLEVILMNLVNLERKSLMVQVAVKAKICLLVWIRNANMAASAT